MLSYIDIHNSKRKIENARSSFQRMFSADNAQVACEFLDRLRIENKSYGRIVNYAECAKRILILKDDKKISKWTKKEIESIHMIMSDTDYENSVKKDTLVALKRLYHFAKHDEIVDK